MERDFFAIQKNEDSYLCCFCLLFYRFEKTCILDKDLVRFFFPLIFVRKVTPRSSSFNIHLINTAPPRITIKQQNPDVILFVFRNSFSSLRNENFIQAARTTVNKNTTSVFTIINISTVFCFVTFKFNRHTSSAKDSIEICHTKLTSILNRQKSHH